MLALALALSLVAQDAPAPPSPAPAPSTSPAPAPAVVEAPAPSSSDAAASAPEQAAPKRPKLLVLDVKVANPDDVKTGEAETLTTAIAARAGRFPLEVVAMTDVRDMVELEGTKQAAGCDTSSTSCLGEIAGALGADLVLATRAGKLDAVFVVSVQLFDAKNAGAEGRASVEAWSLGEANTKLGPVLDELLVKATGAQPTESVAAVAQKPASAVPAVDDTLRFGLQVGGGVAAGLGAVLAVAGFVPRLAYGARKDELLDRTRALESGDAALDDAQVQAAERIHREALESKQSYNDVGRWVVLGGAALLVAGAGALAAGFLLPAPSEVTP